MAFAIEKEERFAVYNAQMCLVHARRVREQLRDDFVLSPLPHKHRPAPCPPARMCLCAVAHTDGAALPAAFIQEDAQLVREGRDRQITEGLKSTPVPLLTCGLVAGIRHCHTPDAPDHLYCWRRACPVRGFLSHAI